MEGRTSKPIFLLLFYLLLLLLFLISGATVVDETCRSIVRLRPRIGYDFCVASLQADPASSGAAVDRRGLAVIATRQSIARATAAVSVITNMTLAAQPDPSLREWLGVCSEIYDAAVDHLNVAMRSLGGRRYREAVTFLSAAADAPLNCEDAFGEVRTGAAASPLAREDGDYGRMAAVALAISASLR